MTSRTSILQLPVINTGSLSDKVKGEAWNVPLGFCRPPFPEHRRKSDEVPHPDWTLPASGKPADLTSGGGTG
jgi:hypothetical protein